MRARALAQWRPDIYKWGKLKEIQLLNHPGVGSLLPPNRWGEAPLPAGIYYNARMACNVSKEQVIARRLINGRFLCPLYRKRRLKWVKAFMYGRKTEKTVKAYGYSMLPDPNATSRWPQNKGAVGTLWPSPYK